MKKRVTLDFETRSEADLPKVGAYKYSLDPTTKPTCISYKVLGKEQVYQLRFEMVNLRWSALSARMRFSWRMLIGEGYEFSAHNAFFERCIYQNIMVARYGWPEIPVRQWRCTAAKAAACALPRSLDKVGAALNLRIQKDRRGHQAVMATCRPTKKHREWVKLNERRAAGVRLSPKNLAKADAPEPKKFLEPADAPEVWEALYQYNEIDTLSEENLDETLPDLNAEEQEIWHLNQRTNWHGIRVDIPTVKKVVAMMEVESKKKLKELDALTMGLVTKPAARKSILEFLSLEGVELPNLQAKTVDDKIHGFELSDDMRRLLEIRRALTLTSTAKYHTFLRRATNDERVRDLTLYHGASTGRDTGVGIQPHNFPKGVLWVDKERPYATVDNVAELDPEMLRLLYGESLGLVFSSILRNMIIPSKGCQLYVGDFSTVEVAVCWWLAGNKRGLRILRNHEDPYIDQAMSNTGKPADEIVYDDRQLGKAQILGAQFGMGGDRFQKAAWDMYRLKLTIEQSKNAILNYRRVNPAVPALWKAYEAAAVAAVENPRGCYDAGKCIFHVANKFLWVTLPSRRKLAYREPQIAWRETEYGPRKTLEFWGVNPKTRKWALERTWGGTLTENIVQAGARDLMMPAMLRLEKAGYRPLMSVHDEALCERKKGRGDVDEFVGILCEVPWWGVGLPIRASGWAGPRYRK